MPSLQNSNAGPVSNLTWLQAARRVARSVGRMNDPDLQVAAKDAISEVIQDWNTEKDWRFLQIIAPPITIVSGTTRYALPSNFKKPYDAYLLSSKVKLEYVEQRLHDTIFPGGTSGPTAGYSLFNAGTTGEIELLPASTDDTLYVRYYRPIAESGADDDFLDLPSRYVPGILAKARAFMCLDAHDFSGFDRWMAIATTRLAFAKADDNNIPDEELRFRPAFFTQNLNQTLDNETL